MTAPNSTDKLHRSAHSQIGQSHERREDDSLLRGEDCFVGDISLEDGLHIAFVRSPYAHAKILSIERAEAAESSGVLGVFCSKDVAHLGRLAVNPIVDHMNLPPWYLLPETIVTAVGQPVVAVAATTLELAAEAAELVFIDYEPLPALLVNEDGSKGLSIFDNVPGNIALSKQWRAKDVDNGFASADHIVRVEIQHARLAPASMETRGLAAVWDDKTRGLTLYVSSQTPHRVRSDIANILEIDPGKIRVVVGNVGGAFGMKASLYPEEVVTAWIAQHLKRSVKWTSSRLDDFVAATHGRGGKLAGEIAFSAAGKLLGLRAQINFPLGHWMPYSGAIPPWNAGRILPGPYDLDTYDIRVQGHVTTTAPIGIYRGAGRPEAAMLMDCLMDAAADKISMDPFEFRAINLLRDDQFPLRRDTGVQLDTGRYGELLGRVRDKSGYTGLRKAQAERRTNGELVGIGICFYIEPSGQGWESARLTALPGGQFIFASGSSDQGQGRSTSYAQIVASYFDVPADHIEIRHGDTALTPEGIGALASRSTPIGGGAVFAAAGQLKTKLGDQSLNGIAQQVEVEVKYHVEGEAWGYGCTVACLSIDPDTGVIEIERLICGDDIGTVINPLLVEGQLLGGIAQGLGEALLEQLIYDGEGQLVTASFQDYAMPRADNMPAVEFVSQVTEAPFNLLGAKGVGEAGTIGVPPAIVNAALDALRPLSVSHLDMPLTSNTVWHAIRAASKKELHQ